MPEKIGKHKDVLAFMMLFMMSFSSTSSAQTAARGQIPEMEARISALEDYIEKLQLSLEKVSVNLQKNVDQRIESYLNRTVIINPASRKLYKVDTNSGAFLIAIKQMSKSLDGYILHMNVGNPNGAAFSDVTITLKWGKKWDKSMANVKYQQWRDSLYGADYTFDGTLEAGTWTEIVVELSPIEPGMLEYLECQMQVNTVLLLQATEKKDGF
jgi:hypothetical protein